MTAPESKTCSKCGETKPLSEYSAKQACCKACHAARVMARYYENVEESRRLLRERQNRRRAANPEKHRAQSKAFREAHPDKHLASSVAWAAANPEKARAYKRKYDQANPDKKREAVRRRRARKAGNGVEIYSDATIYDRDGGRCQHCSTDLPREPRAGWHIDHIVPISLGGPDTPANVQLSCPTCNWKKWAHLEGQIHFAV